MRSLVTMGGATTLPPSPPPEPGPAGFFLVLAFAAVLAGCSESIPPELAPDGGDAAPACPPTADGGAGVPISCAYDCVHLAACAEKTRPYACPNLGNWACIPHDTACPSWDGTYPQPTKGQCTASAPTGDSAKYAGPDPDHPGVRVLPDGRRISPAGSEWIFDDEPGGLTSAILAVPGTSFVLTVDTGMDDHVVRLVDVTKIAGGSSPVVSSVLFPAPATLNSGIAFRPPDLVLVATDDGVVQALKLDV